VGSEFLRKFFRWLLAAQMLFAVFGISAAALGASLARLGVVNDIVVLATCVCCVLLLLAERWRPGPRGQLTREMRVFVAGLVVWFLFIVQANLLGLKIVSGHNWEFIGFLVFVGCLGYISAYRIFANEERLLAIGKELKSPAGFNPQFFRKVFRSSLVSNSLRVMFL